MKNMVMRKNMKKTGVGASAGQAAKTLTGTPGMARVTSIGRLVPAAGKGAGLVGAGAKLAARGAKLGLKAGAAAVKKAKKKK